MTIWIPVALYFLFFAILQPKMWSESQIYLVLFAIALSFGIGSYRNWVNWRERR